MKGAHLRRAPYRPRVEFAIGLFGLLICGIGIGRITADVLENNTAAIVPQERTTTTTVIGLAVIEPEATTTTSTTLAPTTQPPRTGKQQIKAKVPVARHSAPSYGCRGTDK
jgi:hypothetical protein